MRLNWARGKYRFRALGSCLPNIVRKLVRLWFDWGSISMELRALEPNVCLGNSTRSSCERGHIRTFCSRSSRGDSLRVLSAAYGQNTTCCHHNHSLIPRNQTLAKLRNTNRLRAIRHKDRLSDARSLSLAVAPPGPLVPYMDLKASMEQCRKRCEAGAAHSLRVRNGGKPTKEVNKSCQHCHPGTWLRDVMPLVIWFDGLGTTNI